MTSADLVSFAKKSFAEVSRDFTSFGSPLLLGFIILLFFGFRLYTATVFAAMVVIELAAAVVKLFYRKERPNKEPRKNILETIDAGSFPSVHSARASYFSLVLFGIVPEQVALLSFFIPLTVGYTRIKLGKHYFVDVLAGYALGLLVYYAWQIYLLPLAG